MTWRFVHRAFPHLLAVCCVTVAVAVLDAVPAAAYMNPPQTLAGPSAAVVDVDGAAMSPDGKSGGVVYREVADGRTHIFVTPYLNGKWQPPQQVDAGQQFDSLYPRIGAANDGQLVVVWVQRHGLYSDQLWAARLGAGSHQFDPPILVDPNIGEANETYPSLAVAPDGTAYVAYVVEPPITNAAGSLIGQTPTANGEIVLEYRLAKILNTSSALFPPLNARQGLPDPVPTATSAPQVAIDAHDDAAVAWEEPDDQGVPRVWARRVYPDGVGSLAQISPARLGGKPITAPAGPFSLALAGNGDGAIVYLQDASGGSVLSAPRLLESLLTGPRPGLAPSASAAFQTPRPADGLGAFGARYGGVLGPPDVSVSEDGLVGVAYTIGNQVRLAGSGVLNAGAVAQAAGSQPPVGLAVGAGGASVLAWPQNAAGGTLAVQERTVGGRVQTNRASALFPGPVEAIQAAGSTLGDAIVAFQQGDGDDAQIGAVVVNAPPTPFTVNEPSGWLKRTGASVFWQASSAAAGPVTYTVYVDGRLRGTTSATSAAIGQWLHKDGQHHITVIATDAHRQATQAPVITLSVDGTAPAVSFKQASPKARKGRRVVHVTVKDAGSGVDKQQTTVDWGDGIQTHGAKLRHAYTHTGRYRIVVTAYDNAGNVRRSVKRVEILR